MERRIVDPWTWQDRFDFSQAIEVRNAERVVYCAGQVAADENGQPVPGDMVAQFNKALDNLEKVLAGAGLALRDLVRLNYYVTDVPAFLEASQALGPRLKAAGCKPASTLLGVAGLADPAWLIEIEGIAAA